MGRGGRAEIILDKVRDKNAVLGKRGKTGAAGQGGR